MRALLAPAALAAVLATSSLALAATHHSTGTVKNFDQKAMTLTLSGGTTYELPKGFKDPGIRTGEKVDVSWNMVKGKHEATNVKIMK